MPRLTAIGIAAYLFMLSAVQASAAANGRLSSDHGRVGDLVLLIIDGSKAGYSATPDPVVMFLSPVDQVPPSDLCKNGQTIELGTLSWSQSQGSLTFAIPSIPDGEYVFLMQLPGQCWRLGKPPTKHEHEILVLSVGRSSALPIAASPPARPTQDPTSAVDVGRTWTAMLLLAPVAVGIVAAIMWVAGRRSRSL
jgi:hypothetical protein